MPAARSACRAGRCAKLRRVVAFCNTGGVDGLPLTHEIVIVWLNWIRSAFCITTSVGYDTIVIGFLHPFVDDGTAEGIHHVGAEYGGLVAEGTRAGNNAASLAEEDGNTIILRHLFEVGVAGGFVGSITAPLIRVDTVKINGCRFITANQIVLERRTQLLDISRRITDGDLAVFLPCHIRLDIGDGSLDVRGSGRTGVSCDDFVADPEAGQVVIGGEDIHDSCKGIKLLLVPRRASLLDLSREGVKIKPDIDASLVKDGHALIVVGRGINVVDTDGVRAECLHGIGISLALVSIHERILGSALVGKAWSVREWKATRWLAEKTVDNLPLM